MTAVRGAAAVDNRLSLLRSAQVFLALTALHGDVLVSGVLAFDRFG